MNETISERILRLDREGVGERSIGVQVGISRRAVRTIINQSKTPDGASLPMSNRVDRMLRRFSWESPGETAREGER